MTRHLIVNADDFGWSAEVNAGIVTAHDRGIVTSASVMVRGAAVAGAAILARDRPQLSLGLHVDLGEWVHGPDGWTTRHHVVDADDADAVSAEVRRQLVAFEELVGHPPTHLDSHQHVHRQEPVRSTLAALAARLGVPLRAYSTRIGHCGSFFGHGPHEEPHPDGISVANLRRILRSLPIGWTELGCHPGIGVDATTTTYAAERDVEVAVLCSTAVREALATHDIVLASFAELP